jgi:hypothetical protein
LEGRTLLSQAPGPFSFYVPSDLPVQQVNHQPIPFLVQSLVRPGDPQSPLLNNEGKVVSGKDTEGDEWTITVHGPGTVIVTDTTPNDGSLDSPINTIQLLGTSLTQTYVTGNVVGSDRVLSSGTVEFNRLFDTDGVKSVVLNGFTLAQTVTPPEGTQNNANTGIFLSGGVGLLQFHDILAPINLATADLPIDVVIGDPSTPLAIKPTIRLDSIFNTVYDSSATTIPTGPQTTPTVNIIVNGQLQSLDMVSSTQQPVQAGYQYLFPTVGTTGRTAIRALGIDNLNVKGSAINVTAARGSIPFQNDFSGLNHLGHASFGGNADALGLDVNGPISSLRLARGLGNPTGTSTAATAYGTPANQDGYPASGLLGGLVTATQIGRLGVGPANTVVQTAQNPDFVQLLRQGSTRFYPTAGNALTSAVITSSGSIGATTITGASSRSEVKSGFHYHSFAAGLEGTRAPSQIAPLHQRGGLVNSVVSATYRPSQNTYGTPNDVAGPGVIQGQFVGRLFQTGETTMLGNLGAGFFARRKIGYLPPPQAPTRVHGVLVR